MATGEPAGDSSGALTRRTFLKVGAGAGLVAVTFRFDPSFLPALESGAKVMLAERPLHPSITPASPTIQLTAERDADLALVDFTFYGFELDKTSHPPALVVTAAESSKSWIGVVAQLPPQAIGEADYGANHASYAFDLPPVLSQVSGPTTLAFNFTTGGRIELPTMTVADLLDWSTWEINVQPAAQYGSGETSVREPEFNETTVEVPLHLHLAPVTFSKQGTAYAAFTNRTEPLLQAQVCDCWTTTLTGSGGQVSAVWALDWGYDPQTSLGATPETNILYGFWSPGPKIVQQVSR
jgi:hypothetical protein